MGGGEPSKEGDRPADGWMGIGSVDDAPQVEAGGGEGLLHLGRVFLCFGF